MISKRFGILLSTPPSHPSVETVLHLSSEALTQGVDLYLYFIDEGVKNLRDPRYGELVGRGMKLFVCAYGCQQHKISTDQLDSRISLCGLVVLSNIVNGCDRFLAFTWVGSSKGMIVAATVSIALVIREDPRLTHRPVEALRIALGLAAGENPITVILIGQAVQLLAEETDDIVDVEILEKYLPSFQHLAIPFVLIFPAGPRPDLQDGFAVTIGSADSAQRTLAEADRILVF